MQPIHPHSPKRLLFACFVAFILTSIATGVALRVDQGGFAIPWGYKLSDHPEGGDYIHQALWFKTVLETGSCWTMDTLSAPFGLEHYDYPMGDNLHLAIANLSALFTQDFWLVTNVYYFLTFPLAAVCACYVFMRLGIRALPAIVGSILYALLPYHFTRGQVHLVLSAYYLLPLGVLVALRLFMGNGSGRNEQNGPRLPFGKRPESLENLLICAILGCGNFYYAFFAGASIFAAGAARAFLDRQWRIIAAATGLNAVIICGLVLSMLPSILYQKEEGPNKAPTQRNLYGVELYSLKMSRLLLPPTTHRWKPLANAAMRQREATFDRTMETRASLGIVGSIGFLYLLLRLLFLNRNAIGGRLMDGLAILNAFAFLIGTTGGGGAIFAFLVTPQIRCYTRISVLIAFFSLFAVIYLLDLWMRNKQGGILHLARASALLILLFGVADQTSPAYTPDYEENRRDFQTDKTYFESLESKLPTGSMIYQLPHRPFPTSPYMHRSGYYAHMRAALHTKSLRWSYGAMMGRYEDYWHRKLASSPLHERIESLAILGFEGILIDRFAYAEDDRELEKELMGIIECEPIVSSHERWVFLRLDHYRTGLQTRIDPATWKKREAELRCPLIARWVSGFHAAEGPHGGKWRWCARTGRLVILNESSETKTATLEIEYQCAESHSGALLMRAPSFEEFLPIDLNIRKWTRTVEIPPGEFELKFQCDCPAAQVPDPRELVFRLWKFELNDEDAL